MANVISIRNLMFKYGENVIFENLNMFVRKGDFLTVLGSNGVGKTTFAKIITGYIKCDNIRFNDLMVGDIRLWDITNYGNRKVFEIFNDDIRNIKKLKTLIDDLGIGNILGVPFRFISYEDKLLVCLVKILLSDLKVLVIDGVLSELSDSRKKKVISVLMDYNESGLTVINITANEDDALFTERVALICERKVKVYRTRELLENEDVLKGADMEFPFIVSLSNKLRLYNLIDRTYYSKEALVDNLWS